MGKVMAEGKPLYTSTLAPVQKMYPRITFRDKNLMTTATFDQTIIAGQAFDALKAAVAAVSPALIAARVYDQVAGQVLDTMRKLGYECRSVEFGDSWSSVVCNLEENPARAVAPPAAPVEPAS